MPEDKNKKYHAPVLEISSITRAADEIDFFIDEDMADDEVTSEVFSAWDIASSQLQTATELTKLIVDNNAKSHLSEKEIVDIYLRTFESVKQSS